MVLLAVISPPEPLPEMGEIVRAMGHQVVAQGAIPKPKSEYILQTQILDLVHGFHPELLTEQTLTDCLNFIRIG